MDVCLAAPWHDGKSRRASRLLVVLDHHVIVWAFGGLDDCSGEPCASQVVSQLPHFDASASESEHGQIGGTWDCERDFAGATEPRSPQSDACDARPSGVSSGSLCAVESFRSLVSRRGLASLTSLGRSSDSPFQPTGKKSTFYSLRTSTRFLQLQNLNPPKRKTAAHLSRERDSEVGAPQPEPRPR